MTGPMTGSAAPKPAWLPDAKRVTVFTGDYGSGKTEVAVNYTLVLAEHVSGVQIADLDIVNPYFRSREALALMEGRGVRVVTPRGEHLTSELPIVLPEVKGLLQSTAGWAVLDVGGDDVGARVLSSFHGAWRPAETDMLLVVNGNRPFTDTPAGVERFLDRIQEAARVPVTGLVANTHLMEHTTVEDVYRGHDLVRAVASRRNVPVRFVTVPAALSGSLEAQRITAPIFSLTRLMVPPWLRREKLGSDNFRL